MKKKWMISIASFLTGAGLGGYKIWKLADQALSEQAKQNRRATAFYEVLNEWVRLKNEGISLEKFFVDNGYRSIAIYGYTEVGERLDEELGSSSEVEVSYIIDRNPDGVCTTHDVYGPSKELPPVDVIVVTPLSEYNAIEKMLKDMVDYPIIPMDDVVYDI